MAKTSYFLDFAKQNPVITGVGTLVVGYTLYKVVGKIFKKGDDIPPKPPIPPIPPAERKYTYVAEAYPEYADNLKEAFDGIGTDNTAVARIMGKMKTKGDVVALISAYGKRIITSPYGWDTNPMSLSETISYEMSSSDIEKYVNAPLSKTGFQF